MTTWMRPEIDIEDAAPDSFPSLRRAGNQAMKKLPVQWTTATLMNVFYVECAGYSCDV
jgi:hypothetical protein